MSSGLMHDGPAPVPVAGDHGAILQPEEPEPVQTAVFGVQKYIKDVTDSVRVMEETREEYVRDYADTLMTPAERDAYWLSLKMDTVVVSIDDDDDDDDDSSGGGGTTRISREFSTESSDFFFNNDDDDDDDYGYGNRRRQQRKSTRKRKRAASDHGGDNEDDAAASGNGAFHQTGHSRQRGMRTRVNTRFCVFCHTREKDVVATRSGLNVHAHLWRMYHAMRRPPQTETASRFAFSLVFQHLYMLYNHVLRPDIGRIYSMLHQTDVAAPKWTMVAIIDHFRSHVRDAEFLAELRCIEVQDVREEVARRMIPVDAGLPINVHAVATFTKLVELEHRLSGGGIFGGGAVSQGRKRARKQ